MGIDTEWQPRRKKGDDFPVSILQLSTPRHVFIFDLLAPPKDVRGANANDHLTEWQHSNAYVYLHHFVCLQAALPRALVEAFNNPSVLKVGLDVETDLQQLDNNVRRHSTKKSKKLEWDFRDLKPNNVIDVSTLFNMLHGIFFFFLGFAGMERSCVSFFASFLRLFGRSYGQVKTTRVVVWPN